MQANFSVSSRPTCRPYCGIVRPDFQSTDLRNFQLRSASRRRSEAIVMQARADLEARKIAQSTGHFAIGVWTPLATKGDVHPPFGNPNNREGRLSQRQGVL